MREQQILVFDFDGKDCTSRLLASRSVYDITAGIRSYVAFA